ncbi:MAG: GspMb/PilO family protein [Acidobacteriaceae bacterium]|jgi:type IV pilus assembly protein PilO
MKKFRNLFSFLNLHIAGVALLLILNLVLGVRLFLAWSTLRAAGADQLQQQQTAYRALQLEMSPLRGLPQKVSLSRAQADTFYTARFPNAYSTISATINDLATKNSVRLTNLAYTPTPALAGLAELRMDASLSGEYAPLMHFINGLERSKTFFLINGLTLTGSQGGLVNLRLRLVTYLHAADLNQLAPLVQGDEEQAGEENR